MMMLAIVLNSIITSDSMKHSTLKKPMAVYKENILLNAPLKRGSLTRVNKGSEISVLIVWGEL